MSDVTGRRVWSDSGKTPEKIGPFILPINYDDRLLPCVVSMAPNDHKRSLLRRACKFGTVVNLDIGGEKLRCRVDDVWEDRGLLWAMISEIV